MTDTYEIDAVVIGAGVVGLACAMKLAEAGNEVIVLEATDLIGSLTSARNSEVIHAGMYYPQNSLKHKFCVSGRRKLYQFIEKHNIPYSKCGKLIVATNCTEDEKLEGILQNAKNNDVEHVERISKSLAIGQEPSLFCTSALISKETGIIDSHSYMLAMRGVLESVGGQIAFKSTVSHIDIINDGYLIHIKDQNDTILKARILINSAGLYAQNLANKINGFDKNIIPKQYLAKGNYYRISKKSPFSKLIYPVPVDGGLGVHVTFDLNGQMRFGPDVEWLDHDNPDLIDYKVDPFRCEGFYEAIRKYWPELQDNSLETDYSGCRPKLSGPGMPTADFMIQGHESHSHFGLINLFGIESPGLTSSLAIADYVCQSFD